MPDLPSRPPNALSVAGPNSKYKTPGYPPAGFLAGFWHGLIMPVVFLVSLLYPGVRIYETNNNGRWYDFGFVLGSSVTVSGSVSTTAR